MSARRLVGGVLLLLVIGCGPVLADTPTIPALTGRVVDQAGILSSSEESRLAAKCAKLEQSTTIQLVVVTLRSLHGSSIEEWGLALGRGWGIGQRGKDNGILLIVAPTERELRIEVGSGLEAVLTDSRAATIIRNVILPRFKAGNMNGGIAAGIDAIVDVVGDEWTEPSLIGEPVAFFQQRAHWIPWIILGIWLLIVLVVYLTRIPGIREHIYADDTWIEPTYNRRTGRSFISGSLHDDSGRGGGSGGGFSGGGGGFGGGGASGRW